MGGFLTIGYCFPYCFPEIFWGTRPLMEGDKVVMEFPPVPPLGETLTGVVNMSIPL